ncbi:MAG: aldehyde ferredoxin oxidoreductase family protein [Alphaproteobacteria bacterium]|nr:aldehyde ferredoxin oxidoreductase family protein [Alphaproteobacteria bacterium]
MTWHRKILRVNLTKGTCETEPLNMEWAKLYLGSRGLASKYLYEEIDPKVDPIAPDNKLILATGPLTGTSASTSGRYVAVTKGALTGAIACSNSGGFFGAELKFAGYDMLILEGRAKEPVYLMINDDDVRILPADKLWGKSVWETEEWIKKTHQDPLIRVASIGVAGETGSKYACIVNDLHRAAGRSGVGTVMGSKNLKAVAVRGTTGVKVENPREFMQVAQATKTDLKESAFTNGLTQYGTQGVTSVINATGIYPTRNHQQVQFEGADKIGGEAMFEVRETDGRTNMVRNSACFGCTIACGRVSVIDPNHFSVKDKPQYHNASGGLEYESSWAMGGDCGIDDLEALTYANFICNEQGMDTISFGASLAAAMELYERGYITDKETGGLKLKFGSAEALVEAVELAGKGEGFGKDLGLGSKLLCEKYGHPEVAMTVKGQEFAAYDPRGAQGMSLAYATSNRGACHLRGYTIAVEIFGVGTKLDPLTTEGKAEITKLAQDTTSAVDSTGLCMFPNFAWTLDQYQQLVQADSEGDWSMEKMMELGERVWNLERLFNNKAGLTTADDTLPKRLLETPAETGVGKGLVALLDKMLPEYYELRGWTPDGQPSNDTIKRLNV